jgi:hypothetical protein
LIVLLKYEFSSLYLNSLPVAARSVRSLQCAAFPIIVHLNSMRLQIDYEEKLSMDDTRDRYLTVFWSAWLDGDSHPERC